MPEPPDVDQIGAIIRDATVVTVTDQLLADGPALSAFLRQCFDDADRDQVDIVLRRARSNPDA